MKKLFFAALIAFPLSGANAAPKDPINNDSPVQCGAAYFLYWKLSEAEKKPDLAETYRRKFEILSAVAAPILSARGLNKEESDAYMQKHINSISDVAAQDYKALLSFKNYCDGKFPNAELK